MLLLVCHSSVIQKENLVPILTYTLLVLATYILEIINKQSLCFNQFFF